MDAYVDQGLAAPITIEAMQLRHQPLSRDIEEDGVVALLAAGGPCPDPSEDCPADFDNDNVVEIDDSLVLLVNWT